MPLIVTDSKRMKHMNLASLWANYEMSIDLSLDAAERPDPNLAYFYMCVSRVTLDAYFSQIDAIVEKNLGRD